MSIFARNLRFLRNQRGLNQKEVSVLFNKKGNTIGNWENRKSEPSIGELVQLADYFHVDLHELLHTDLQKQALNTQVGTNQAISIPGNPPVKSYAVNESSTSMAQDGSSDSFWLILRELRLMNEKLDSLKETLESDGRKSGADKSNH